MSKTVMLDVAVEAAAEAFHNNCKDKGMLTWDNSTEEWRRSIRGFVRPIAIAVLDAALDVEDGLVELSPATQRACNH